MSVVYNFVIGRKRALLLAGCFVAAIVLTFVAGTISGMLIFSSPIAPTSAGVKPVESAAVSSAIKSEKASSAPVSEAASGQPAPEPVATTEAPTTAPVAATAAPVSATPTDSPALAPSAPAASLKPTQPAPQPAVEATSAPPKSPSASPTAPVGASAKASTTTAPASQPEVEETSFAIPLAVRVGSFTVKSNADELMVSLKGMGYNPSMSHFTDTRGRLWYVVKLGPFHSWNDASMVSTRVSIAENVQPIIAPMR